MDLSSVSLIDSTTFPRILVVGFLLETSKRDFSGGNSEIYAEAECLGLAKTVRSLEWLQISAAYKIPFFKCPKKGSVKLKKQNEGF